MRRGVRDTWREYFTVKRIQEGYHGWVINTTLSYCIDLAILPKLRIINKNDVIKMANDLIDNY